MKVTSNRWCTTLFVRDFVSVSGSKKLMASLYQKKQGVHDFSRIWDIIWAK